MTKITIVSWNADGLRNKKSDLIDFLNRTNIDIILLSETRLIESIKLKIKNYHTIRKDTNSIAGGVTILVKIDVSYTEVKIRNTDPIENICIKLASNIHERFHLK